MLLKKEACDATSRFEAVNYAKLFLISGKLLKRISCLFEDGAGVEKQVNILL